MFLAPRLIQGSAPQYQGQRYCERQWSPAWVCHAMLTFQGAMPGHCGTSRPRHPRWTSGLGADESTRTDGQASVPAAMDHTGPLARQLSTGQPDTVLSGTKTRDRCLPLAASCGNVCVSERKQFCNYCSQSVKINKADMLCGCLCNQIRTDINCNPVECLLVSDRTHVE